MQRALGLHAELSNRFLVRSALLVKHPDGGMVELERRHSGDPGPQLRASIHHVVGVRANEDVRGGIVRGNVVLMANFQAGFVNAFAVFLESLQPMDGDATAHPIGGANAEHRITARINPRLYRLAIGIDDRVSIG